MSIPPICARASMTPFCTASMLHGRLCRTGGKSLSGRVGRTCCGIGAVGQRRAGRCWCLPRQKSCRRHQRCWSVVPAIITKTMAMTLTMPMTMAWARWKTLWRCSKVVAARMQSRVCRRRLPPRPPPPLRRWDLSRMEAGAAGEAITNCLCRRACGARRRARGRGGRTRASWRGRHWRRRRVRPGTVGLRVHPAGHRGARGRWVRREAGRGALRARGRVGPGRERGKRAMAMEHAREAERVAGSTGRSGRSPTRRRSR